MIDTCLDAEIEFDEPIIRPEPKSISYYRMVSIKRYDRLIAQEDTIRAAIKKLDGVGMPHRAREVIQMLREAVDED